MDLVTKPCMLFACFCSLSGTQSSSLPVSLSVHLSLSTLHYTELHSCLCCFVGLLAALCKTAFPAMSPRNSSHEKYSMCLFEELHKICEPFEDDFVSLPCVCMPVYRELSRQLQFTLSISKTSDMH